MKTVTDLIDFLHSDKSYDTRKYIVEQIVRTPDQNKGFFWEKVLAKAMPHCKYIGGNNKGYDFLPCMSDAKIATFYKKTDGKLEASIGIKNKVGTLRVCLVVPGQFYHRVCFMLIPYESYKKYLKGSGALKVHINERGAITGKFAVHVCKWAEVIKPLHKLDTQNV